MTAVLQQPVLLLLAATCGLGIFLLVAGSALHRSPTDLVTRLRRLDPDSWWEEPNVPRRSTAFGGPLSEDASRLVGRVFGYVGLIAPADLARSLAHAGSGMTMHEFYFEKILTALGLEAVLVVADFGFERFGLTQVGVWPLWLWLGVGVLGFVMPDLVVRRRASVHQTRLRAELPTLVDLLAVAVSTGRGIEDAVVDVAPYLSGPLATEWRALQPQLALGLPTALSELTARNRLPELDTLAGHLTTAYERGQALQENLVQLSETLRERRIHEVTAAGGRATERMFLPVVFFVFLPLLVLVMAPAAASLASLLNS